MSRRSGRKERCTIVYRAIRVRFPNSPLYYTCHRGLEGMLCCPSDLFDKLLFHRLIVRDFIPNLASVCRATSLTCLFVDAMVNDFVDSLSTPLRDFHSSFLQTGAHFRDKPARYDLVGALEYQDRVFVVSGNQGSGRFTNVSPSLGLGSRGRVIVTVVPFAISPSREILPP